MTHVSNANSMIQIRSYLMHHPWPEVIDMLLMKRNRSRQFPDCLDYRVSHDLSSELWSTYDNGPAQRFNVLSTRGMMIITVGCFSKMLQ